MECGVAGENGHYVANHATMAQRSVPDFVTTLHRDMVVDIALEVEL